MNNINDTYFARRFEQNINDITDIRKCGYWQMPFIPYTFRYTNQHRLKLSL